MIDISEQTGLLAVQGPDAVKALQPLTDVDLSSMPHYHFTKGRMAGIDNVLISATGYTGAGGFELYVDSGRLAELWEAVLEAGRPFGIRPAGLGARDTLRLEMGFCLYGNDIDDRTSPLEAGLGWITKLNKGDFIARDLLVRQKAEGVARKLVGFTVDDRRVPRHDYPIENADGEVIGHVTSGTQSPSLGYPIGMGYVRTAYANVGAGLFIVAGKKRLAARIVKLPFLN
jgi:aminomethyltransferase